MMDDGTPDLTCGTLVGSTPAYSPHPFTVCSLLYVDDAGSRPVNLKAGQNPLDVYVACACLLARSAKAAGERFVLITNQANVVSEAAAQLNLPAPELMQLNLRLGIPRDIPFYQAHFKLALMEALGLGVCGPAVALLDLDMVICKPFTHALSGNGLTAYDITDQVSNEYVRSLTPLLGAPAQRWYGGEFLAGPADSFAQLSECIRDLSPPYVRDIRSFAHIGDETVVSAALNQMAKRGAPPDDAGRKGLVVRWWSSRTKHRQPTFALVEDACVLHLPSDKPFLAREAASPAPFDAFTRRYRASVRPKLLARAAAQVLQKRSAKTLYAARLGQRSRSDLTRGV